MRRLIGGAACRIALAVRLRIAYATDSAKHSAFCFEQASAHYKEPVATRHLAWVMFTGAASGLFVRKLPAPFVDDYLLRYAKSP